jgi:hypothetical protein
VASAEHEFPDSTARYGLRGAWIRRDNAAVRTVLLATDNDTPESWIRAGAGLQHVLLEATCLELAPHLATMPLEVPVSRDKLRHAFSLEAWPQPLIQIARAQPGLDR